MLSEVSCSWVIVVNPDTWSWRCDIYNVINTDDLLTILALGWNVLLLLPLNLTAVSSFSLGVVCRKTARQVNVTRVSWVGWGIEQDAEDGGGDEKMEVG